MLRRLVKTGIASALHGTGIDEVLGERSSVKNMPFIIGYHRVVEDFRTSAAHSIPPSLIGARTLERHLDWIGRRFDFVTLDDVANWLESGRRFHKPVAAVTFDDGYSDMYHHALPILRRKGIPAAVFVVTDLAGTPHLQIHDRLYLLLAAIFSQAPAPGQRLMDWLVDLGISPPVLASVRVATGPFRALRVLLEALPQAAIERVAEVLAARVEVPQEAIEELRSLTWEMLEEMSQMGITVGSHTKTHARLSHERWQKALEETEGSRRTLERKLGTRVAHFAYPDGCFNAAAVGAVAASGYRCAYTICQHRDPRHPALTIPRTPLWENSCLNVFGRFSPAIMGCHANVVAGFTTRCRKDHGT